MVVPPLTDAFATAAAPTTVVAVGVNCCPADQVLDAVRLAVEVGKKKAVAYPNGGGEWDARARAWVGTPGVDADLARSWADAGAAYLGGCCRVGPADIERLVAALDPRAP